MLPRENTRINYIANKISPYVLVAFPGVFRFFAVFLCTLLLPGNISEQFSSVFLISSFLVSFIGLPVAASLVDRHYQLSFFQKYYFVIILSALITSVYYMLQGGQLYFIYIDVFAAVVFLSFFEIQRSDSISSGDYSNIFTVSIVSFLLLLVASWSFYVFNFVSCSLIFFLLFLPNAIRLKIRNVEIASRKLMSFEDFILRYRDYSLSSFFSTSTNTAIPLIVASFSNKNLISDFAQVFAAASLAMLVPRALSAKMIPVFRKDGPSLMLIDSFRNKITTYIIFISLIAFFCMYYLYENFIILWLYFFSVQCSQINLPYSNALSVDSKSADLLKINMLGFCFLVAVVMSIYALSLLNVLIFMCVFLASQFIKLHFSMVKCRKLYGA